MFVFVVSSKMMHNVLGIGEVAKFGSDYFLLKIKIVAECEGVFTVKFVIVWMGC